MQSFKLFIAITAYLMLSNIYSVYGFHYWFPSKSSSSIYLSDGDDETSSSLRFRWRNRYNRYTSPVSPPSSVGRTYSTSQPSKYPSELPSPMPTYYPTKKTTYYPTELPTPMPTYYPTESPTPWPTFRPICSYNEEQHDGKEFLFVILIDNSCGLDEYACNDLINGAADVVASLMDYNVKIATFLFDAYPRAIKVVRFGDEELQRDVGKYIDYMKEYAECTEGGRGYTDLVIGMLEAYREFETQYQRGYGDHLVKKIIVISACKDRYEYNALCGNIAPFCEEEHIDVYTINLINLSYAKNVIESRDDALSYLQCLAIDPERICVADSYDNYFDDIIEDCLAPSICSVPTWPTPEPTSYDELYREIDDEVYSEIDV